MSTAHIQETVLTDADKAAVASLPQRVVKAWGEQDAAAFAQVFTPDGTMILPGVYQKGQDAIEEFMAAAFAGPYKGTRVTGTPLDLRPLGRDAAVVVTQGGVLAPGEEEVSDARAIRATWVAVRHQEGWRLAAYQNSPRERA
ncbi:SgcJ/EcaC family oxidoreductase [Nocardiopsis alba]|uniref:SgcJ/EcaC family oxidoreductase n=1 Tax=Nocardiopsis alba TaxID=53437 RepID=UPI0035DE2FD6